ncbi:MAG TPA: hypothetical protein VIP46_08330 [Pyrinomonadaceae bacterium]
MKRVLTPLAPLLLIAALSPHARPAAGQGVADRAAEESAVYAAAIAKLFAGNKVAFDTQDPVELLVIKERAAKDFTRRHEDVWDRKFFDESPEALSDFREQNREPGTINKSLRLPIKHLLLGEADFELAMRDGWEGFFKRHPKSGGWVALSRVGFNREMTQALVYFEHGCGGLCGSGIYLLLEKGEAGWKVAKVLRAWIS